MSETTVCLSDLCDLIRESVAPGERPDDLYLGLEHIASGRFTRIGGGHASEMRSSTSRFKLGDVLYGKLRPYLDKAILAEKEGVCTTELLVLRAKAAVDPRFLAIVLHSPDFVQYAVAGTTGVQHPRTSWAHIRGFNVSCFTREEQVRVADFLWLVHRAIVQTEALVEATQTLKRAAMQKLFTCGLRNEPRKKTEIGLIPESWSLASLGTLCEKTDTVNLESEGGRMIEYVDVSSISRESLKVESTSRFMLKNAPGRARKRILAGDVIFATVRPTLLRAACITEQLDNQVCSTAFCVLRRDQNKAFDKFIYYLIQRTQFIQQLAEIETGASYPAVTDRLVKARIVPVPDMDEQREIVTILDTIDRKADLHRQKHAVLNDLFKTLLHQLMTGKIRTADLELSEITRPPRSS